MVRPRTPAEQAETLADLARWGQFPGVFVVAVLAGGTCLRCLQADGRRFPTGTATAAPPLPCAGCECAPGCQCSYGPLGSLDATYEAGSLLERRERERGQAIARIMRARVTLDR